MVGTKYRRLVGSERSQSTHGPGTTFKHANQLSLKLPDELHKGCQATIVEDGVGPDSFKFPISVLTRIFLHECI